MNFSSLLSLALATLSVVSAGPIEIYITEYSTLDVVETVTQTQVQVVQETQYVN